MVNIVLVMDKVHQYHVQVLHVVDIMDVEVDRMDVNIIMTMDGYMITVTM